MLTAIVRLFVPATESAYERQQAEIRLYWVTKGRKRK